MPSITKDELNIIKKILNKHIPSREVWAFGSRLRKNHRKHSDLDLAILGTTPLSLQEMAELREAFEDSLLEFRVDLIDWNTISPDFRNIIKTNYVKL